MGAPPRRARPLLRGLRLRRRRRSDRAEALEQARPRGRRRERQHQERRAVQALRAERVVVEVALDPEPSTPTNVTRSWRRAARGRPLRAGDRQPQRPRPCASPLQALLNEARPVLGVGTPSRNWMSGRRTRRRSRRCRRRCRASSSTASDRLRGGPHVDGAVEALDESFKSAPRHAAFEPNRFVRLTR